jgi:hypothetical protein
MNQTFIELSYFWTIITFFVIITIVLITYAVAFQRGKDSMQNPFGRIK